MDEIKNIKEASDELSEASNYLFISMRVTVIQAAIAFDIRLVDGIYVEAADF